MRTALPALKDSSVQPPPPAYPEDRELARSVVAGDPQALGVFSERIACLRPILAAQNARVGGMLGEHDLADLAQDSLLVAWKKLPAFDGATTLEAWLYTICYYLLMNRIRKHSLRLSVMKSLDEQSSPDPQESVPDPWRYEELYASIEKLPSEERVVIQLKHFKGLTFKEVGERLSISTNTIKARYYRARTKLMALLNPELVS